VLRRNLRTWLQRGLLAGLVCAVVVFGLRAGGSVARELTTVDGSVWLVDPPNGSLVQVNALARDVTAKVAVAGPRQQLVAAQVGRGAVVLNRSTSSVGRVDGATAEFKPGRQLAATGSDLALVGQDAGVFAIDTAAGKLVALDADDLSTRYETSITAGQATPSVVDDRGRLWAYDGSRGELVRFDAATGDETRRTLLEPGVVAALTLSGGRPVLVRADTGEMLRIGDDAGAGQRLCRRDAPLSDRLVVAGSAPGDGSSFVFALDPDSGALWTADLQSGSCRGLPLRGDRQDVAESFGSPVVSGGLLYVPLLNRSRVLVVDGRANRIERTIDLAFAVPDGNRFELFAENGRLWFNDLQGAKAGVLSAVGAVMVVDKKASSSLTGGDLGAGGTGAGTGLQLDPSARIDRLGTRGTAAADTDAAAAPGSAVGGGTAGPSVRNRPGTGGTSSGEPEPATASTLPSSGPRSVVAGPDGKPVPPSEARPDSSGPPRAQFSYSPPGIPTTGTVLDFTDGSTGRIDRWRWTFSGPDGSTTTVDNRNVTRTLGLVGTWTVLLTVSNDSGASDTTAPVVLQVRDANELLPPQANFSWDPPTPIVGQSVQFRDRTTVGRNSPVTSWYWEFGDGTTSTAQSPPAKSYSAPGNFVVRLTVRNAQGANSVEAPLRVAEPPAPLRADFSWTVDGVLNGTIAAGQVVVLTDLTSGGPTSWSWDLGDGSTGSTPTLSHVFRNPGEVTVRLTVSNNVGSQSIARTLRIDAPSRPPQAKISFPAPGATLEQNRQVVFASASTGNPTTQAWDFGDGSVTVQGSSVLHTFTAPGTYVVTLTVSNGVGSTSDALSVTVVPEAPLVPGFTMFVGSTPGTTTAVGVNVAFVNTSIGVGTFSWNFGDGSTSTDRNPLYAFTRTGAFPVTLTMTDGVRTATASVTVTVTPAPVPVVAAFDYTPKNPTVGQPVDFVDRTTGTPSRWTWSFGDGTPVFVGKVPPAKVYAAAGTYEVSLAVIDGNGAVTTALASVVVVPAPRPAPVPTFTYSPSTPDQLLTGKAVLFTDTSAAPYPLATPVFTFSGTPVSPPAGSRSIDHVFAAAGTYAVSMSVCWVDEPANCASSTQNVVIVDAPTVPVPAFSIGGAGVLPGTSPAVLLAGQSVTFSDTSTGSVTSWQWIIGTGTYTTKDVTLAPAGAGTLTVTLTVTGGGGSATVTRDLLVLTAVPTATFTVDRATVYVGDSVTFTDGAPASATRTWTFGDGSSPVVTTAGSVTHAFTAPATVTVSMTVSLNGYTTTSTQTLVIQLLAPAPAVAAVNNTDGSTSSGSSFSVTVGSSVSFADVGSSALVDSRSWTWNDAAPGGTAATISRTFTAEGTYVVTLQVTNAAGSTSVTFTVIVTAAPTP